MTAAQKAPLSTAAVKDTAWLPRDHCGNNHMQQPHHKQRESEESGKTDTQWSVPGITSCYDIHSSHVTRSPPNIPCQGKAAVGQPTDTLKKTRQQSPTLSTGPHTCPTTQMMQWHWRLAHDELMQHHKHTATSTSTCMHHNHARTLDIWTSHLTSLGLSLSLVSRVSNNVDKDI